MKIISSAPTRIDLAGGTLDIYPLYIFLGGGVTVNCAIDLISSVEVDYNKDRGVHMESMDLGEVVKAGSIREIEPKGVMELVMRAVRFCDPENGVSIKTRNTAPKGSGLGASSSLLVALMWALQKEDRQNIDPGVLIEWCANVEAMSLGIPTGKQDYYAAFYGGINAIHFDERGIKREAVKPSSAFMKEFESCLILSFTGISHFSGATNWDMMKSYIDNSGSSRENLKRIKETAYKMKESLIKEDIQAVSSALSEEWENRKRLAVGVTNEKIEKMIESAKKNGALASKICGAGGGGCMITIARPEKREAVIKALKDCEASILDFRIQNEGLKLVEEG